MTTIETTPSAVVTAAVRPLHAYLALAAGVIAISFTAIFTKWAAVPGPVAATYRMAISAVILTVPFLYTSRRFAAARRRGWRLGLLGGLWFALNLGLLNSALMLTSAATATLLDNTAPVWVGIGALLLFGEQLGRGYWAGLALALAGAVVVTGLTPFPVGGETSAQGFHLQAGDALALTGAIFYAAYLLNTQRARQDLDTVGYLWLVAVTAALLLFLISLLLGLPLLGHRPSSYLALVGVGIISQVGGWLLISYALGYLPASSAVVVLLAQPVVTGLLAIPLLGESLAFRQVLGGALVLSGIYLCLRHTAKDG